MDLEDELSLIIGKNNCGKTSLLLIIDKFLNSTMQDPFAYDDFNLDFFKNIQEHIEKNTAQKNKEKGISLKLFIDYNKDDNNLANISNLMMDLDPENNEIVLLFEYVLIKDGLQVIEEDFNIFKDKQQNQNKDLSFFLKKNYNYKKYFKLFKKTVSSDENSFIDLEKEKISLKDVINYKFIKANREVSNKESEKSLSIQAAHIYEKIEKDTSHKEEIDKLDDELNKTDNSLNSIYSNIFSLIIERVRMFGGIKPDDTTISITSTLEHKNILKGNTTVLYNHNGDKLPEYYNGLGYMNLINMIFEIEIKINEFKREKEQTPADINLFFIEEPEAHTHPQMQYIFIRNIKNLLKKIFSEEHNLQCIISTHSSHITAESDFNDIKYLKNKDNSVIAKNLKDLEKEYKEYKKYYKFLKQYLTLHRSELFFADKVIFIEGDTERILLPAMMKKIDNKEPDNPLLSQNISIIETGAYSHIFAKFIDFIGVKSLIITDIDSANDERKKCEVKDGTITTNASLKFFYDTCKLEDFKDKKLEKKIFIKKDTNWVKDKNGFLLCVYQTNEKNLSDYEYYARSFEDSFFHLNRQFIIDNKDNFQSLKNIDDFDCNSKNPYDLSEKCIGKKPAFAIEILLNSDDNFNDWKTPDYIKQGLLWLKED